MLAESAKVRTSLHICIVLISRTTITNDIKTPLKLLDKSDNKLEMIPDTNIIH